MAQKQKIRPIPMDEPPTASSSSSEEQSSSQEEASSDDNKEQNLSPAPKTQSQSETETESESESESDTVPAKVEAVASKPKEQAQKPKAQASPTPSKSGSKRAAESNSDDSDPKPAKNKSLEEKTKDDEKKTPRRWSEDEEVAILKGVVDFTSKMKQDPLKVSNAFHDFMIKLPDWEHVSRDQLKAKLRGLKRKFDANVAKEEKGETLSFSKPHEQKVFELSKKAWGPKPNEVVEKPNSNGTVAKSSKKNETGSSSIRNAASAKKPKVDNKRGAKSEVVLDETEKMDIDHEIDGGNVGLILGELSRYKEIVQLDEDELKRGLELIGESKRAEFEQKWKELRHAEIKLLAKRSQLIAEQTNLMIDALEPSDDYDSQ